MKHRVPKLSFSTFIHMHTEHSYKRPKIGNNIHELLMPESLKRLSFKNGIIVKGSNF